MIFSSRSRPKPRLTQWTWYSGNTKHWKCTSNYAGNWVAGYGPTPKDAYEDWLCKCREEAE